jgi:hypothetical protein
VKPTRTLTRTIGTGITTFTETVTSGSTTTTSVVTTVVNTVATETVTGNFIAGQTNVWYGSASSPCVSVSFIVFGHDLAMLTAL